MAMPQAARRRAFLARCGAGVLGALGASGAPGALGTLAASGTPGAFGAPGIFGALAALGIAPGALRVARADPRPNHPITQSPNARSFAQSFDFSPAQPGRIRAPRRPDAARLLHGLHFVAPGALSVAIAPGGPPLATYATDARTVVGADPDYAQLVADALGLKLALAPVAWADWPLGLASGRFDAVISNVGVTEARKQKFDFSTYRQGLHGFYVPITSALRSLREPRDIAGLRIIVGSGTIQERILIEWNRQNVARGLRRATLQYFDDLAASMLALQAGRADAILGPHAALAWAAATQGRIRLAGLVNAGWPLKADVAIATRRGSGFAPVLTDVTNGLIAGGQYRRALARWALEDEAIGHSQTNPPGYRDD